MMKSKMYGLLFLAGTSVLSVKAQQVRSLGDFTGIKAGDAFKIVLSQSDANSVKVDAPDNVLPQIKTEVKDGILEISADGTIKTGKDKPLTISIGIKELTSLDVSGASDLSSENQLSCSNLRIQSSGVGDISLDLKAGNIQAKISGAGDVTLKGTADMLDAGVSGAGNLKASNLEAASVKAKVSGAGNAKVYARQSLDADVSGSGDIIYKGSPADRTVNISGAGSVRESKSGNGEETASDTTKIKLGNKKYTIIGDDDDDDHAEGHDKDDSLHKYNHSFKHWTGVELGVNGFMDYNNNLNPPVSFLELNYAKSYQFGLNLFEKDFHIYKNYINIVTGVGFNFNHFAFDNNITLQTNNTPNYISATADSVKYKKNTLNVSYVRAPLMLEINTSKNPERNFHIAGGLEFEYMIHAVTKQKYDQNDNHYKIKKRDDFNLDPFSYSAVARIGYNHVTVYATYGLNRLFKKDEGPQVYPVSLGISWTI